MSQCRCNENECLIILAFLVRLELVIGVSCRCHCGILMRILIVVPCGLFSTNSLYNWMEILQTFLTLTSGFFLGGDKSIYLLLS